MVDKVALNCFPFHLLKAGVLRSLFASAVVSLTPLAPTALAQDAATKWSFADHPHPSEDKMTAAEIDRLRRVVPPEDLHPDRLDDATYCPIKLDIHYAIYRSHYPAFETSTNPQTRRKQWQIGAFASPDAVYLRHCLHWQLARKIEAFTKTFEANPDFVFCGRYSRSPVNTNERALKAFIDEYIAYAKTGYLDVSLGWENWGLPFNLVKLNADVAYYFAKISQPPIPWYPDWRDMADDFAKALQSAFDDERRVFLDAAVARRDFDAVAATTAPCILPENKTDPVQLTTTDLLQIIISIFLP